MKRSFLLAAITALTVSTAHAGAIYKCVVDGQTTFSQKPCAPDAEVIRAPSVEPSSSPAGPTAYRSSLPALGRPKKQKDHWVPVEGEIEKGLPEACLDLWRPALLDPRGAYVVSSRARRPLGDLDALQLIVDASVTTAAGGKKRVEFVCPYSPDGVINEKNVNTRRAAYQEFGLDPTTY